MIMHHISAITKSSILTKKRRYTYSEVEEVTNKFEKIIGEGGFGTVYHGFLTDNKQVAVKVLSHSSTQGYEHFKAEVISLELIQTKRVFSDVPNNGWNIITNQGSMIYVSKCFNCRLSCF